MKILSLATLCIFFCAQLFAYQYSGPLKGDYVWSKVPWYDAATNTKFPDSVSPGPADFAVINTEVTLDKDITLKGLSIGPFIGHLKADSRKINLRRMGMNIVGFKISLKNSTLNADMISISKKEGVTTLEDSLILLEDSSIAGNALLMSCSQSKMKLNTKTGVTISLIGASNFTLKSDISMDEIFRGPPSTLYLKFKFADKDGKVPYVKLGEANLKGILVEAKFSENIKAGKYDFFVGPKSDEYAKLKITINGTPYNLKDTVKVGEKEFSLSEGKGKFGAGLILTVK